MKDYQESKKNGKYSDLLLVDLLHLDWKHLFTRYRTDIVGFIIFCILMLMIVVGTTFLIRIGS